MCSEGGRRESDAAARWSSSGRLQDIVLDSHDRSPGGHPLSRAYMGPSASALSGALASLEPPRPAWRRLGISGRQAGRGLSLPAQLSRDVTLCTCKSLHSSGSGGPASRPGAGAVGAPEL